ncbi:MAG: hypothetical protein Athens041674_705 [Parcubacteria group bacterium Athens0416_74]|nr:MAG: hypothetical protein Athens041674_705 [Parcubacteria group bacterium Athens0416_74]
MADTIVNTPAGNSDSGAAGWMVALIVLIAVIGGGFVRVQRQGMQAVAQLNNSRRVSLLKTALTGGFVHWWT